MSMAIPNIGQPPTIQCKQFGRLNCEGILCAYGRNPVHMQLSYPLLLGGSWGALIATHEPPSRLDPLSYKVPFSG